VSDVDVPLLLSASAVAWCGVLLARWKLLWGSLFAAAGSLTVSLIAADQGGLGNSALFRREAWLGLFELVALGLLAGASTRLLRPIPLTAALLALTASVVAITEWRQGTSSNVFVNTSLLIGLGGCIGTGALLRRSDTDRAHAAERARQDERLAIARDLHDVVAHHVTGIAVQAQAGRLVARSDPERAARALADIEGAAGEALTAMRRMVGAMRTDAPIAPAATLDRLADLARHSEDLGLAVLLDIDTTEDVPADVAHSVHRVVGEALTNAHRHATGATTIEVRVEKRAAELGVVVVDDGRSRGGSGSGGFGLLGMAERVHALGGEFDAGPQPHGGWEVRATFPLPTVAP
jgi:signal transduction histidine kinase